MPGAVVGGRLGFLILHAGFYGAAPQRLLDPAIGGLELGLAVVGGFLTGSYVASLLGAPVGRWLHLAAAPLLLGLAGGKLAMVLTGAGQGLPSDAETATAYLGHGPWGSLVPALPSQPSQAFEGIATLAILALLALALRVGAFRRRDGRLFFVAIGAWAVARALCRRPGATRSSPPELNPGGLIAVAIAAGSALALVILTVRRRGPAADAADRRSSGPASDVVWPDPETRRNSDESARLTVQGERVSWGFTQRILPP